MFTKGGFSVTAAASTIVAADADRSELVIQHYTGSPFYLGFGDDTAVKLTGIELSYDVPVIVIKDYRTGLKVTAVCDTALAATGGYQEA